MLLRELALIGLSAQLKRAAQGAELEESASWGNLIDIVESTTTVTKQAVM